MQAPQARQQPSQTRARACVAHLPLLVDAPTVAPGTRRIGALLVQGGANHGGACKRISALWMMGAAWMEWRGRRCVVV